MPVPFCVDRGEVQSTGNSQVTINRPSQAATGDLMIAVSRWHVGGVAGLNEGPGPLTAPSGWTQLVFGTLNDAALTQGYSSYEISYRQVQAGEAASYVFGAGANTAHGASWAQASIAVYRNAGSAPRYVSMQNTGTNTYSEFPAVASSVFVNPHSLVLGVSIRTGIADVHPWTYGGTTGSAQEQAWNAGFRIRFVNRTHASEWLVEVPHGPPDQPCPARRHHYAANVAYVAYTLVLDSGTAMAAGELLSAVGPNNSGYLPILHGRGKLVSAVRTIGTSGGGNTNTGAIQWSYGPAYWEGGRMDTTNGHWTHTAIRGVTAGRQDSNGNLGPSDILIHATHSWHLESSTHMWMAIRAGWWTANGATRTVAGISETIARCSSNNVMTHVGAGGYVLASSVPAGSDFFAIIYFTPNSGPAGFAGGFDFNDMATLTAVEIL